MHLFEYIDILNQPFDIFLSFYPNSQTHWHYYSEILYVTKGSVSLSCNNHHEILNEGDLCYIYPLWLHETGDVNGAPAEYAVLRFDIHTLNIPPVYLAKFYEYFIHGARHDDQCIILRNHQLNTELMKRCMEDMISEFTKKEDFYSLQIQALLHTVLIHIAKQTERKPEAIPPKHNDNTFSFYHILEYIDTHSGEPLEIRDLAGMCHMSYSHFAKLFRETYGRSCKEYITYIRLNKAQDFLLHTDYDINYIALETGFFDCSHFIRTYKKWKGITPKQARLKSSVSPSASPDSDSH